MTAVRAVALIVNPSAGGGRAARARPAVEARLAELGMSVRTDSTRDLAHARKLAAAAVDGGEVAVTLGGDGLIGCVAGALRDRDGALLGVLPGGRGNDFCRVAGIPLDPVAACEVIAAGVVRAVDVGEAGGRTFIGIASVGFDSDANRLANMAPARLGRLVYVYGALRALASWKPAGFTVQVDGERHELHGWTVAVANSKAYGGGLWLAPDAELDDGALDVVLCAESSRLHFLRTLPKVAKGRHLDEPNVRVLRGAEVRVCADRPFTVYADGEPFGELPITVRAVRHAVRVLLPAA